MKKYLFVPATLSLLAGCASDNQSVKVARWNPEVYDLSGQHGNAGFSVTPLKMLTKAERRALEQSAQGGTGAGVSRTETIGPMGGGETLDQANLELHKEELVVGKRAISNGGVLIRRVVQTEEVSQPVELRREEYVIERIPAGNTPSPDAAAQPSEGAFQERQIFIPLTREEPVTAKRVLLTENIQVGKRIESDRVTITQPVRTEDVEIVKVAANAAGNSPSATTTTTMSMNTQAEPGGDTLKLAREELIVGKKQVANGGVKLVKTIRTEQASQNLDLKREEFTINRQPLNDQPVDYASFSPREIRIDLSREEAVPATRSYVAQTVRVRKQIHLDKQVVAGTVRRENLEIVKNPSPAAGLSATRNGDVSGQGGTGMAAQSGASSTSESGLARPGTSVSPAPAATPDQVIAAEIRAALAEESKPRSDQPTSHDYSKLETAVQDGVVTLCGTVASDAEKRQVAKRVESIDGVRSVKNELQIDGKKAADTEPAENQEPAADSADHDQ